MTTTLPNRPSPTTQTRVIEPVDFRTNGGPKLNRDGTYRTTGPPPIRSNPAPATTRVEMCGRQCIEGDRSVPAVAQETTGPPMQIHVSVVQQPTRITTAVTPVLAREARTVKIPTSTDVVPTSTDVLTGWYGLAGLIAGIWFWRNWQKRGR